MTLVMIWPSQPFTAGCGHHPPYVRAEVTRIIEHHGVFQMFYYGDAAGLNKDERERYRGHEWFESCERLCRDWDQMAFDPIPDKAAILFRTDAAQGLFGRLIPPSSRHLV